MNGARRRDFDQRVVALEYNPRRMKAPVVSLRGSGETANAMLRMARRYGISVVDNGHLVDDLDALELEECVPHQLYDEVAEVFVHLKGSHKPYSYCRKR